MCIRGVCVHSCVDSCMFTYAHAQAKKIFGCFVMGKWSANIQAALGDLENSALPTAVDTG